MPSIAQGIKLQNAFCLGKMRANNVHLRNDFTCLLSKILAEELNINKNTKIYYLK